MYLTQRMIALGKSFLRFCSITLSLVIGFQLLPTYVWAQNTTTDEANKTTVSQLATEDTYIIEELDENQTGFSKEILVNNGLYMAVAYSSSIYYQENKQWKNIDNTLKHATTRSVMYMPMLPILGKSDSLKSSLLPVVQRPSMENIPYAFK